MGVSCIICAYNEAPRIGAVLSAVSTHPLVDEVIVVDDGSIDGTADVVRAFPSVRLISYAPNRGKSFAMAAGVAAAKNATLMLLDADLKGLTAQDVAALAEPVLSGRADLGISLRGNSLRVYRLLGLDFVSGERVLRRELLSEVLAEIQGLPRFGIEVFMNERIIARRLSIAVVRWSRVMQARKAEKLGLWKGTVAEFRMLRDLARVKGPLAVILQISRMRTLRISGNAQAPLE
jgi:glycosyltransferase involved in cell wall biosynthesis